MFRFFKRSSEKNKWPNGLTPSAEELSQMVACWKMEPLPTPADAGVRNMMEALKKTFVNEEPLFYQFKIKASGTLDYFASRNKLDEIDFVNMVLGNPVFQKTAPALTNITKPTLQLDSWISLIQAAALIAGNIYFGGAYSKPYREDEALALSTDFIKALTGWRTDEMMCWNLDSDWSDWFHGICFDFSYMFYDKENHVVSVLCISDYD